MVALLEEFTQIYPKAGCGLEHDPMEIWATQNSTLVEALAKAGIRSDGKLAGIEYANQRNHHCLNKETGKPVYNAIVWRCRRGGYHVVGTCGRLVYCGQYGDTIRLLEISKWPDTDNVEGAREAAEAWQTIVRYGWYLVSLEDDSRTCSRYGLHQRVTYYVVQHQRPMLGPEATWWNGHSSSHDAAWNWNALQRFTVKRTLVVKAVRVSQSRVLRWPTSYTTVKCV